MMCSLITDASVDLGSESSQLMLLRQRLRFHVQHLIDGQSLLINAGVLTPEQPVCSTRLDCTQALGEITLGYAHPSSAGDGPQDMFLHWSIKRWGVLARW